MNHRYSPMTRLRRFITSRQRRLKSRRKKLEVWTQKLDTGRWSAARGEDVAIAQQINRQPRKSGRTVIPRPKLLLCWPLPLPLTLHRPPTNRSPFSRFLCVSFSPSLLSFFPSFFFTRRLNKIWIKVTGGVSLSFCSGPSVPLAQSRTGG